MLKRICSEKGLALIITLLVTAIIVAVITEIVNAVYVHTSFTTSYKDGQRAAMLAAGGIELAASVINNIMKDKGYTMLKGKDTQQVIAADDSVLSLKVEDEQAKFCINSIVLPNGETNGEQYTVFSRLLKSLELRDELADTLADWIDVNDEPRPMGGEAYDYYNRLSPAYAAKGGGLDTLEEILLVKGYTPQIYKRLMPFITVYTDEPGNIIAASKININTAPREIIMALSNEISEQMAQGLIDYRDKNPFNDTADIRKVPGFETIGFNLQGKITVKSNIFRISARASIGDGSREVEAVVDIKNSNNILYWRER